MVNQVNKPITVEPTLRPKIIGWGQSQAKLIDEMRKLGKKHTDFMSPKNVESTCTQEYYDDTKLVIAEMLGKKELFLEPAKGNTARTELVKQIGSKLGDLMKLLRPKADKADPKSDLELFMQDLNKAQKRLMDNEDMFSNHNDIVLAFESLFDKIGD